MTIEELTQYLKTWAKVNAQEVYGSPRAYLHLDGLLSKLDKLTKNGKETNRYY